MKPAPGTVFLEDKFNKVQVRPAPNYGWINLATIWFKPQGLYPQARYQELHADNFDPRVVDLVAQKLIDIELEK